jgi:hypothetical protein
MSQTLDPIATWDEVHYIHVASRMLADKKELGLFQKIGTEQFLNHLSTVFYVPSLAENLPGLEGIEIAIHVGKTAPDLQRYMRTSGIKGLIGMTPQFPCSNPQASWRKNLWYVDEFEKHLIRSGINYLPVWGRARDFKEGAGGCFILIDVTPEEAKRIIYDQLSFTYLPARGKGQLVSL